MFAEDKLDLILRRYEEIGEKLSAGADGQSFVALSRERAGLDDVVAAIIAWRAARLPIDHPDPWDRILVAQAMALDAPLISNDKTLRASVDGQPGTHGVIVF